MVYYVVVIPLSLELKMIWLLRSKHPQQPVVAVSHVTQAMENVQRRNLEEPFFKKNIHLIYKEIFNMIIRGHCSVRQFSMQSFVNCSLKPIKLENCSISKHEGCGIFAFKYKLLMGIFFPCSTTCIA